MSDHDLFFSRTGMDRARVQNQLDSALKDADVEQSAHGVIRDQHEPQAANAAQAAGSAGR
jgi:hypothetical protein